MVPHPILSVASLPTPLIFRYPLPLSLHHDTTIGIEDPCTVKKQGEDGGGGHRPPPLSMPERELLDTIWRSKGLQEYWN
jgi:hypothetical protein